MALSAERLRALEEALELVVALRRSVETSEIVQRDLDALLATSNDEPLPAQQGQAALTQETSGTEPTKVQDQTPVVNAPTNANLEGQLADRTEPVSPNWRSKPPPPGGYVKDWEPRGPVSQNPIPTSQPKHDIKSRFISWIAKIIGRARPKNEQKIR
jgi:hypothetical protein